MCAAMAACESVALPILPILSLSRALSIGRQQDIDASICYVHIARSPYLSYSYPHYLFPSESHALQPPGTNTIFEIPHLFTPCCTSPASFLSNSSHTACHPSP